MGVESLFNAGSREDFTKCDGGQSALFVGGGVAAVWVAGRRVGSVQLSFPKT
jgi:hypothetical protein